MYFDVCIFMCILSLCAGVMKQQKQPASYDIITINTNHKVTDHYNVHEKLGL